MKQNTIKHRNKMLFKLEQRGARRADAQPSSPKGYHMTTNLDALVERSVRELACERCGNRGSIMTQDGPDECPSCQGYGRNTDTIALLRALVARQALGGSHD